MWPRRRRVSFGFFPAVEAGRDCAQDGRQSGEVPVAGGQASRPLPKALDGRQRWAVRRQEEQAQILAVPVQQRREHPGVVVRGGVQHQNHALAGAAMAQHLAHKGRKSLAVEHRTDLGDQAARAQVDGAEAAHRLARGRMRDHGIALLRRNPHATARSVLREMALVQAPQVNVAAACQRAEFFLPPPLPAGRTAPPAGAACAAESPSAGTSAGTA